MVWGKNENPFEKMCSDENYLQIHKDANGMILNPVGQSKEFIYKYIIPAEDKKNILRGLSRLGVNEKSIFPGLDGIGKYVESTYRLDDFKELLYNKYQEESK